MADQRDTSTETNTKDISTVKRALMIQAHPDDCEFSSSGTIAKWVSEGVEVHYCSITSGDKGSSDPTMTGPALAAIREREQRAAADVLGVKSVTFLGYSDATLVADLQLRRALTRVIRQIRPDMLMVMNPTFRFSDRYINHPDHVAAGEASLAAVFPSARDRMTFPELLDEGLEPHKVRDVYVMTADKANTYFDISEYMDIKIAALKAHASQVKDWDPSDMIRDWARENAKSHPARPEGFGEYAESFFHITLD
jgi:LmbE family N-acetylglucosaminyl deacetylase